MVSSPGKIGNTVNKDSQ